jgi:hypothetical protein
MPQTLCPSRRVHRLPSLVQQLPDNCVHTNKVDPCVCVCVCECVCVCVLGVRVRQGHAQNSCRKVGIERISVILVATGSLGTRVSC